MKWGPITEKRYAKVCDALLSLRIGEPWFLPGARSAMYQRYVQMAINAHPHWSARFTIGELGGYACVIRTE